MLIFVSYRSVDRALVETMASDLHGLGHTVWFDQELTGGHAWWNSILESVRQADLFIFALTPESLDSYPCQLEYGYADALGKRILPVLLKTINSNLLPPELSKIQFVDYRIQDKKASISLARALASLPPAVSLPHPLPPSPEAPISGLGRLKERIESTTHLSLDEQAALLFELKGFYQKADTQSTARELLNRLQNRSDLFANINREIESILGSPSTIDKSSVVNHTVSPRALSMASERISTFALRSLLWHYFCAVLGAFIFVAPMSSLPAPDVAVPNMVLVALVTGVGLVLVKVMPRWLQTYFRRRTFGLPAILSWLIGAVMTTILAFYYTRIYFKLPTYDPLIFLPIPILTLGFVIGTIGLVHRPPLRILVGGAGMLGFYLALFRLYPDYASFPLVDVSTDAPWRAAHAYGENYQLAVLLMLLAISLAGSVLVYLPELFRYRVPELEQ